MHNYLCLEQKMEKKGSMKSHVCALNNVVPTEAKLCGRTGEEEGGEEGGSTARWGGRLSWGEERSGGSLWAWEQDRRWSTAWRKRLSLVPSVVMGCSSAVTQLSPSKPSGIPTILLSKSVWSESKAARQAQCSAGPTADLERIFPQTLHGHHRYLGLGRPLWHRKERFKHACPSGLPLSQLWPPHFPDYPERAKSM